MVVRRLFCILCVLLIVNPVVAVRKLKQSTAISVTVGPFFDDTDGKTPETALTVTGWTCTLFKGTSNSSLTITASGGDNDAAHIAAGRYSLELTAGNTDTLGHVVLEIADANARQVTEYFEVCDPNAWDYWFNTGEVKGVDLDNLKGTLDSGEIGTDAIGADEAGFLTDSTGFQGADVAAIKAMTDLMAVVTTDVDTPNDANNFTISAGRDANDAYWMHAIMVEDAGDSHSEVRWIETYESGREVTTDEPFSFTPAASDNVWILGPVYGGFIESIYNRLGVTQVPVYYYDQRDDAGSATYNLQSGSSP
jgi:hypothetical protein